MYAEVVINLVNRKVDRVFHYSVPAHLQALLKEGMQVIVPFGARVVDGYVVGFAERPNVNKTKDIIKIADDELGFDSKMLELARWMSKTYLCPLVDSLHAVMPPGQKLRKRKRIFVNEGAKETLPELQKMTYEREREVYQDLFQFIYSEKAAVEPEQLVKRFGQKETTGFLELLKRYGLGGIKTVFHSGIQRKRTKLIYLSEDIKDEVELLIEDLNRKAPRQAEILGILASEGRVTLSELKEYGCSTAALKALQDKMLVKAAEIDKYRDPFNDAEPEEYARHKPTQEQLSALTQINNAIDGGEYGTFLLHGVTGSGKTEVYLQAIEKVLGQGKQAICLVPEISLTPQTVKRFRGRFGDKVAVLHSALSAGERFDQWRQIREGLVQVVVGARSAVFAPFANLGLIILDEEHETTYKQEDNPRYHAREVAIFRAKQNSCALILGSATPSLEAFQDAITGKIKLISMSSRVASRPMPKVRVVDMRRELEAGNRSIFSERLQVKMQEVLSKGEQIILFLNRRGHSTFVACRECGYVARCKSCNISLTYHAMGSKLVCHYCGYKIPVPKLCPQCHSRYIRFFGLGTQRVEAEIEKLFPTARLLRMDVDTTYRKGAHERILSSFAQGEADILIGTQMIAKGLDFPRVTLVGVITADTSLNLPDFRSAERTFQLLTQVSGRAGRSELPGTVVVQTYEPEHYSIEAAVNHDYLAFFEKERRLRMDMEYPPFSQLARIVISGFDENKVIRAAHSLADTIQSELIGQELMVNQPLLGPAPAPLSRLRNKFRWQICLKALDRSEFTGIIERNLFDSGLREQFKELNFSIEIDPQSLL